MQKDEVFNSISHLIGACLAIAGLVVLIVRASQLGDPWKIVSFSVYGATLVILYLLSTIYHSTRGRVKDVFQKLDHIAIYLLIAGTYTPFALVSLRGTRGWIIFGIIWGLAITGIIQENLLTAKRRILSLVIYLSMGWLALAILRPLMQTLTQAGLLWMLAGGLFYTVGVIFYALDKKISYGHPIFHIFVLAGSACHYFTILFYVV